MSLASAILILACMLTRVASFIGVHGKYRIEGRGVANSLGILQHWSDSLKACGR